MLFHCVLVHYSTYFAFYYYNTYHLEFACNCFCCHDYIRWVFMPWRLLHKNFWLIDSIFASLFKAFYLSGHLNFIWQKYLSVHHLQHSELLSISKLSSCVFQCCSLWISLLALFFLLPSSVSFCHYELVLIFFHIRAFGVFGYHPKYCPLSYDPEN